MIAIDLSKQLVLDVHPKAVQQINFTGNLDPPENTTMFFITEKSRNYLIFCNILLEYCKFVLLKHNINIK